MLPGGGLMAATLALALAIPGACNKEDEPTEVGRIGPLPGTVRQAVEEGGPNPGDATLTLSNPGTCDLSFQVETVTTDGKVWLSVAPASDTVAAGGSLPLAVSLDVVTGQLTPGTYVGTITIAGGSACTGAELGPYGACLHAGEIRWLPVPGRTDCTGLTAADALDAFVWVCVPGSPSVKMVSAALRRDRRLADLIDFGGPSWRPNSVTVSAQGEPILTSVSAPWHTNPLVVPALGSTTTALGSAGTIYLVPTSSSGSVNVTASSVGLVVHSAATLTRLGGNVNAVAAAQAGTRFLWLEGAFTGGGSGNTVQWNGVRFSVMRKVRALRNDISLVDASSNRLFDLALAQTRNGLVLDATSAFNTVERVLSVGGSVSAVPVFGPNNVLAEITAANGRVGVYVFGSASNLLAGVTAAAPESSGIWIEDAPSSTAMNLATASAGIGVDLKDTTTAQVHNLASTDHFINATSLGTGVWKRGGAAATFSGLFEVGGNAPDCKEDNLEIPCATLAAGASVASGVSLGSAFWGPVTQDDAANPSDTAGAAPYSLSLDFFDFEHGLRGWGKDVATVPPFPSFEAQGECVTGTTCRIWDWSLRTADTVALGVLAVPPDAQAQTLTHTWTVGGAIECAAIPGAAWSGGACTSSLLVHALELGDDGVGNDNLLCEPGERCLYTPNLGAYQGHGALVGAGAGGPAGDVALFRYAENGR